jgi:hypothetical protein
MASNRHDANPALALCTHVALLRSQLDHNWVLTHPAVAQFSQSVGTGDIGHGDIGPGDIGRVRLEKDHIKALPRRSTGAMLATGHYDRVEQAVT